MCISREEKRFQWNKINYSVGYAIIDYVQCHFPSNAIAPNWIRVPHHNRFIQTNSSVQNMKCILWVLWFTASPNLNTQALNSHILLCITRMRITFGCPLIFRKNKLNNLLNAIGFFDSIVEQLRKMVKLLSSYSSRLVLKTSHSIRFTKIIYPFHLSGMLYIANGIAFLRSQPSTKNIIQFQYVWCILLKFHGKANIELACEKKNYKWPKERAELKWWGENHSNFKYLIKHCRCSLHTNTRTLNPTSAFKQICVARSKHPWHM